MSEKQSNIVAETDISTKNRRISLAEIFRTSIELTKNISGVRKPLELRDVFVSQSTADDGDIECISITIIQ
jgi:hypothetical protein